ncbi:PREDICTED: uncharacterized protein LOC107064683 [Polistes dominula]|uniref:Uncharacterized protein LOC107064683 n=1 Tax=Polistes dominula TaxID=743375 RepID=A0ABM1HYV9_POLDO|nr:PREDICTED: uncharacterized protein LOC107064683 [Polistes dominula]
MTLPPLFSHYFPTFVKDTYNNEVNLYWYHPEFSQSRYPPGQGISEACTLICLLVAQRVSQGNILINNVDTCPELSVIMAEAMVEGNATHAWIISQKLIPHPYLNTEEALKYGGRSLTMLKEWKFHVFHEKIETSLYTNIKSFLIDWYKDPLSTNLFMLLITCGRTVLFIFQEITYKVILFDSHGHSTVKHPNRGLVVAQTSIDKLESLCDWYNHEIVNNCYNMQSYQYELAFLYPENVCKCNSCFEE